MFNLIRTDIAIDPNPFNKAYPPSARNLNRLTKMVDVDVYDENSTKLDISGLETPIKISVERMKAKDKDLGVLKMPGSSFIYYNP